MLITRNGYANETITVYNKIYSLNSSFYKDTINAPGADVAFVTNYGDAIRYFYDGSEPTKNLGHVLPDGGVLILEGRQKIENFKFTNLSGETTLTVTYERRG